MHEQQEDLLLKKRIKMYRYFIGTILSNSVTQQ